MSRVTLLAIAAVLLIVATLMPPTHVDAVRVAAMTRSALTSADCSAGKFLVVSFQWHGEATTHSDYAPDCGHDYLSGDPVTLYVASNDPTNIGPSADWILNPDTHDPFDFIGPNGLRGFIAMLGTVTLLAALVWYLASHRRRTRAVTS